TSSRSCPGLRRHLISGHRRYDGPVKAVLLWAALSLAAAAARADEIAFIGPKHVLFLVPAPGGQPGDVLPHADPGNHADFAPARARMVVDGGLENRHQLWVQPIHGAAPPRPFDRGTEPRWSRDGKRIAYGCFLPFQNGDGEDRYFAPLGVCVVA